MYTLNELDLKKHKPNQIYTVFVYYTYCNLVLLIDLDWIDFQTVYTALG